MFSYSCAGQKGREVLDKREEKKISAEDLVKMAEFALKK